MKKKKIFYLFLSLLILSILAINCPRKSEKRRVKLTYLMWGRAEEISAVKGFIDEFEKRFPDIKVEVIHAQEYYSKLQTMMSAGTPPDVMYMGSDYFPGYVSKGTLLDLTPFIKNDPDTNLPPFNINDYFPEVVKPFIYKGRYYGIPKDFTTLALYYNKDIFDKMGIKYPKEGWTWKDFKETAIKLTQDFNGDGLIDQFGFVLELWLGYWISWIRQNGGKVYDEATGKYVIGKEPYLSRNAEAIKFLYDLMYKYHCVPTLQETRDMGTSQLFETGKVGMCTYGRWRTLELKHASFRWDVAPLPRGKKKASVLFTVCYSISSQSKHKKEAWKLVKFLVGEIGQKFTAQSGLAVPSLKSIAYSDYYLKPPGIPVVNAAIFRDQIPFARVTPPHPRAPELNEIIERHMEEIFVKHKPIKKELKAIQKEIDELIHSKYEI